MFNYKRKEEAKEAQEAVARDKRARVQPQPQQQQQLLLRATEPALQHNQAAICCINTHDTSIYNTTIYTVAIAVHLFAFDVPELHLHPSYLRQFHVMKFSLYFAHLRNAFSSAKNKLKVARISCN